MSAVDWSDIGNLEFCKGSGWEDPGNTIAGAFLRDDGMLVVVRQPTGLHVHLVTTADGRIYNGTRIIRNKPKRVTLEECWVIYTPDGVRYSVTSSADTASKYTKNGFIVRHIPAEVREV